MFTIFIMVFYLDDIKIFYVLFMIVLIGMLVEWYKITRTHIVYVIVGFAIIPYSTFCIIQIYLFDKNLLLIYIIGISFVDTFAMIGGKTFGGPKLSKYISPNKTWSGLFFGAFCSATIVTFICNTTFLRLQYEISNSEIFCFMLIFAFIEQLSDLSVSFVKRKFGFKESGNLIPGHGGMLDRFDGTIFTAPIVYLYISILN